MANCQKENSIHSTTILSVRRNNCVAMVGDGQATAGSMVMKNNAQKVRRLGKNSEIIAGFAGTTADAFTLFELFEAKFEQYGELKRSAVELAKHWRGDKKLGKLEAMLALSDQHVSLLISGIGDVIEPNYGIMAIGSGGAFAQSAALALMENTELSALEIATRSLKIAADICIYTNHNFVIEEINGLPVD